MKHGRSYSNQIPIFLCFEEFYVFIKEFLFPKSQNTMMIHTLVKKVYLGAVQRVNALSDYNQGDQHDLQNLTSCQAVPCNSAQISALAGLQACWRCQSPRYTSCTWQAMLGLYKDKMRSPWASTGYLSLLNMLRAVTLQFM